MVIHSEIVFGPKPHMLKEKRRRRRSRRREKGRGMVLSSQDQTWLHADGST
jgi:hypothetical protein